MQTDVPFSPHEDFTHFNDVEELSMAAAFPRFEAGIGLDSKTEYHHGPCTVDPRAADAFEHSVASIRTWRVPRGGFAI